MSGVTAATPANGAQGHEDAAYAAYLRERQLERLKPYLADAWKAGREVERAALQEGRSGHHACHAPACTRTDAEVLAEAGFDPVAVRGLASRVLLVLLRRQGRYVPVSDLFAGAWEPDMALGGHADARLVRVQMSRVRGAIEPLGWCVDSLAMIGYRLHRKGDDADCVWGWAPRSLRPGHNAGRVRPAPPDEVRSIRALAAAGWTTRALRRKFHRCTPTIMAIVRREGRYADDQQTRADGGAG